MWSASCVLRLLQLWWLVELGAFEVGPCFYISYLLRLTRKHFVFLSQIEPISWVKMVSRRNMNLGVRVPFLVALLLLVVAVCDTAKAYSVDRRQFFKAWIAGTTTAVAVSHSPEMAQAVISSKYCAYGTGDGCEDLAEGNEYIRQLQARSAANKETIQQEAKNAFYMKNYPDWFASVGKSMIKKPDGTFMVVDDSELQKLKDQNKIGLEYATTLGGRVTDLTQKPILVLKE